MTRWPAARCITWRWATSTRCTQVGDTGRVWYSGSPEVTNFDDVESDPGHVLVVDIDEAIAPSPSAHGMWATGGSSRCTARSTPAATSPTST